MHLVGFIIRICHDARSHERKKAKHVAFFYPALFVYRNSGRSYSTQIDNSFLYRVEESKYLETTVRDLNYIQEEIKSRLKTGNASYRSVRNILSTALLFKKI